MCNILVLICPVGVNFSGIYAKKNYANMCCAVFAGMMRVIHVQPGKYETDNNINPCPGSVHIDGLTL